MFARKLLPPDDPEDIAFKNPIRLSIGFASPPNPLRVSSSLLSSPFCLLSRLRRLVWRMRNIMRSLRSFMLIFCSLPSRRRLCSSRTTSRTTCLSTKPDPIFSRGRIRWTPGFRAKEGWVETDVSKTVGTSTPCNSWSAATAKASCRAESAAGSRRIDLSSPLMFPSMLKGLLPGPNCGPPGPNGEPPKSSQGNCRCLDSFCWVRG
mmetsp:Transcript_10057/g.18293  ORF Transcript_10057/g.18293 Transcript_10057/m.18293 type:complete len:206 (+) Transcript_10057:653-1270(+)